MAKKTTASAAPGLSVAKVSINTRLSEETLCFSCDLLWNGKKVGEASNRGTGGMTDVHFNCSPEDRAAVLESVRGRVFDGADGIFGKDGKPLPMDLDNVVDELVAKEDLRKRIESSLKRNFKTKTVYEREGNVWISSSPFTPGIAAQLRAKYPDAVIYNELPLEEAVARHIVVSERQADEEAAKRRAEFEARIKRSEGG